MRNDFHSTNINVGVSLFHDTNVSQDSKLYMKNHKFSPLAELKDKAHTYI